MAKDDRDHVEKSLDDLITVASALIERMEAVEAQLGIGKARKPGSIGIKLANAKPKP